MVEATHLKDIPTEQIERNRLNPRLKFVTKKMKILRDSIEKNGVLVPVTVYWESENEKYTLIDGERRWICSKELGLNTVPAVVIPEPDPESNLLRMFSIHHMREQWSLIATALKLEQLIHMMEIEDTKQLSTLTGMSTVKVNYCKRILSYPKKYQDILLVGNKKERVRPDFFVELYPVLEKIPKVMPNFYDKIPRNEVIDNLVIKFRDNKISAAREFRNLRKLLDSVDAQQIPIEKIEDFFITLIEDPNTKIEEILREFNIEFVTELDKTRRICDSLSSSLLKIENETVARTPSLRRSLTNLREQINKLLLE